MLTIFDQRTWTVFDLLCTMYDYIWSIHKHLFRTESQRSRRRHKQASHAPTWAPLNSVALSGDLLKAWIRGPPTYSFRGPLENLQKWIPRHPALIFVVSNMRLVGFDVCIMIIAHSCTMVMVHSCTLIMIHSPPWSFVATCCRFQCPKPLFWWCT